MTNIAESTARDDWTPEEILSHDRLREMLLKHDRGNDSDWAEGETIDLSGYIIEDFDFGSRDLACINARGSIFIRCNFTGCDFYGSYFNDSEFIDVDFSDTCFVKAELNGMKAKNTRFDRANLFRAELQNVELVDVSFCGANLDHAFINRPKLIRTTFSEENRAGISYM
jgi:uncharacterized protein YjbI with pentapeptide repeats